MNLILTRISDSFASEKSERGAGYRYGGLAVILGLMLWDAWRLAHLPSFYPYDRYSNTVVALMLLLNHLAFTFHWPRATRIALRVAAVLWIIVALFYICYLSQVWFPIR